MTPTSRIDEALEYAASLAYEPKMSGAAVVILAAEVRRLRDRVKELEASSVPVDKVIHLMAMLLRIGLVKEEWLETWHSEMYALLRAQGLKTEGGV